MKISDEVTPSFYKTTPFLPALSFLWEKSEPLLFGKILETQLAPPFIKGGGREEGQGTIVQTSQAVA